MSSRPPHVDPNGNINVHVLEDIYIPVLGSAGADISARSLWFEIVGGSLSVELLAHPSDPLSRLVHVTAAKLRSLPNSCNFALVDRTGPARVKWSGQLKRFQ